MIILKEISDWLLFMLESVPVIKRFASQSAYVRITSVKIV
jgi:hypothetical protein